MNQELLNHMRKNDGFVAALDQSGGSTPKALADYGITQDQYDSESEMYDLVHQMRARILSSPAFTSDKILGTILFEQTMDREINGQSTSNYLLDKGIAPFVKVDQGLETEDKGVQLMKDMDKLDDLLKRAIDHKIFGTKMRSVIHSYNEEGIKAVVDQQIEVGKRIIEAGLVPILEPEVNIHAEDKEKIEAFLAEKLYQQIDTLDEDQLVMVKISIPTDPHCYDKLAKHPNVVRIIALSGGYDVNEANAKLKETPHIIASFSRALLQDLSVNQSDEEFNNALASAIDSIYDASVNKAIQ